MDAHLKVDDLGGEESSNSPLDLVLPPGPKKILDRICASHSASSLHLCLWVEEDNAKVRGGVEKYSGHSELLFCNPQTSFFLNLI